MKYTLFYHAWFPRILYEAEGSDTGASLIGDDTLATGDDTPPSGDDTQQSLIGDDTTSSGDDTAPVYEDMTTEGLAGLVPEGYEISDEQSTDILEAVNSAKGDPAKIVQNMLALYGKTMTSETEAAAQSAKEIRERMQNEIRTDPTYGGPKLEKSLADATEVAKRFGGNEFLELLRVTGAGNSIHMLKFLQEVRKAVPQEATPPGGGKPAVQPKSFAERVYTTTQGA